jgi:hypothetical protein
VTGRRYDGSIDEIKDGQTEETEETEGHRTHMVAKVCSLIR